jgi:hypothetical protein
LATELDLGCQARAAERHPLIVDHALACQPRDRRVDLGDW